MKKFIIGTLIFVLASQSIVFANSTEIEKVIMDMSTYENTVLARDVGESLGYNVIWNESDKSVTFSKDNQVFEATVGTSYYTLNDKEILLDEDTATILKNSRAYIPECLAKQLANDGISVDEETACKNFTESLTKALIEHDTIKFLKQCGYPTTQEVIQEVEDEIYGDDYYFTDWEASGQFLGFDDDSYKIEESYDVYDGKYYIVNQVAVFENFNVGFTYEISLDLNRLLDIENEKLDDTISY